MIFHQIKIQVDIKSFVAGPPLFSISGCHMPSFRLAMIVFGEPRGAQPNLGGRMTKSCTMRHVCPMCHLPGIAITLDRHRSSR